MKHLLIALLVLIISMSYVTQAQEKTSINQQINDAGGNPVLVGKCTIDALLAEPYISWYRKNYDSYVVDSATCVYLSPLLKDKKITIFLGTWCGDSKRQVPAILKMLDCCNFPKESLTLIMVSNLPDAYKQSPQHEELGKNIHRVPTLIIEDKNKEMGRIVEYPVVSLERDMLSIVRKERYVPNYSK
jgi:hypothetical protein